MFNVGDVYVVYVFVLVVLCNKGVFFNGSVEAQIKQSSVVVLVNFHRQKPVYAICLSIRFFSF